MTQRMVGGIPTEYTVVGEGIPVLLLHGWGVDGETMLPVAQALAKAGFEAHVLDFPGFGKSALPPQPWRVEDYARWVVAYLDVAHLERVHLIGHSFGGRVSLVMGGTYPERIEKIALSNSAGIKLPLPLKIQFYYLWRRLLMAILSFPGLGSLKLRVRDHLRKRYGSADYLKAGPLQETFKLVVNEDLLPYARRIQAPTLLFWGDQDQDTPLKIGRVLEREIPDAALILFNGAGHYAYLDQFEQFIRIVVHFLGDKA